MPKCSDKLFSANHKSVVSEKNIFSHPFLHLAVQSHLVRHVGQIGAAGRNLFYDLQCIGERKVRDVLFDPQGVEYQYVRSSELVQFAILDLIHIRNIAHAAYPETQYRQFEMPTPYGYHLYVFYFKLTLVDSMQYYIGNARITVLAESIGEFAFYAFVNMFFGIYVDRLVRGVVESAYIVQPRNMILMVVSEQYGFEMLHALAKHLLTEIGAAVDKYIGFAYLDQHRRPKPFVVRIARKTNLAFTGNYGDTLRSPRA